MSVSAVPAGGRRRQKSSAGCALTAIWAFVLGWYGFLAIIGYFIVSSGKNVESGVMAILGVFGLAGLLIVGVAIRATINAFRFRGVEVELSPGPGVLGGKMTGSFIVPRRILRLQPLEFHVYSMRRSRGSHHSTDTLLWETSEPVTRPMETGAGSVTLPFSIALPYDADPTTDSIDWSIELRTPGGATSMNFEVPVQRTPQSSPEQTKLAMRPSRMAAPDNVTSKLKIDRSLDGVEVSFPGPTWPWKWFTFLAGATIAAFVAASIIMKPMRAEGMPESIVFAVYFAIAAVALILTALSLFSLGMYVRRLRINRGGIELTYAGPMRKSTTLARNELSDVTAVLGAAQTYSVDLVRADGRPMFGALMTFKSKNEAEWLAAELRRAIFKEQG